METIVSALKEELHQAEKLIGRYEKELKSLPDGTFFVRKKGEHQYGYITRSQKGVIKQEYLGKLDEKKIEDYREKMERKKKFQRLLKQTKKQKDFLEKAIRHAGKEG